MQRQTRRIARRAVNGAHRPRKPRDRGRVDLHQMVLIIDRLLLCLRGDCPSNFRPFARTFFNHHVACLCSVRYSPLCCSLHPSSVSRPSPVLATYLSSYPSQHHRLIKNVTLTTLESASSSTAPFAFEARAATTFVRHSKRSSGGMAKREVVIILVVLILALAVWVVLGLLFVRHLRRNKPIQDTVGGVPVRWAPSASTARAAARVSDTEKANLSPPPARARHSTQQIPLGSSSHTAPPSFDLEAQPSSSESVVQASAVAEEARPHAGTSGQTRLEGGLPARHDRQEPVSVPPAVLPLEPRRLPEAPTTDISIPTSPERPPDLPAQPKPPHLPYTGAPPTYEEILRS